MMNEIPYGYCQCGCGEKTNIAKMTKASMGHVKGKPMRFITGHHAKTRKPAPLEDRLWPRVDKSGGENVCWNWFGQVDGGGYGSLLIGGRNGKMKKAHRLAYELTCGEIPQGLHVCHKCDNTRCCNPAHLFLGTHKQNMEDKVKKGRQPRGKEVSQKISGELHGMHKLSVEQVRYVRERFAQGDITKVQLAKELNVSDGTIRLIVRREIWKDVA